MHYLNSFVAVVALIAAPLAAAEGLATELFIAKGESLLHARALTLVARQSLASLPTCAQPAIEKGITSTDCSLTDYACICHSKGFVDGVTSELKTACSADEQTKTLAFANQICASAGAPLDAAPSTPSTPEEKAPDAAPASDTDSDADSAPEEEDAAPTPTADDSAAAPSASTVAPPYPAGNATGGTNSTNSTTPFLGAANELRSTSMASLMSLAVLGLFVGLL